MSQSVENLTDLDVKGRKFSLKANVLAADVAKLLVFASHTWIPGLSPENHIN